MWHMHALMTDSPVTQLLMQLHHHTSGLQKINIYVWNQHTLSKDIPVALPVCDYFILLLGLSGLPKILLWLCLTPLVTFALWGALYDDLEETTHLDLCIPTIKGVCTYVHCQFTTSRWRVTCFYQKLSYVLVVLNLSTHKIIGICYSVMMSA